MKSITAVLLTAVLSLLLVGEAQALGDRGVAQKALSAHSVSYKQLQRAQFSPEFINSWTDEAACINEILAGVDAGPMTDEEKFDAQFSTLLLATLDYVVGSSKDRSVLVQRTAKFLDRKSKSLRSRSDKKRGKVIARSLRGHAQEALFFMRGANFDFCLVRDTMAGTYTFESYEAGLEAAISPQFEAWINTSNSASTKLIDRGVAAMKKVRPRIKANRINNYNNVVTLGLLDAFPEETRVAELRDLDLRSVDLGDVRSLVR